MIRSRLFPATVRIDKGVSICWIMNLRNFVFGVADRSNEPGTRPRSTDAGRSGAAACSTVREGIDTPKGSYGPSAVQSLHASAVRLRTQGFARRFHRLDGDH